MHESAVYVVRVYRRDAARMAGVMESVASGEHLPFRTTEELWNALRDLSSSWRQSINGKPEKGGRT
jgi:hypothetical protein